MLPFRVESIIVVVLLFSWSILIFGVLVVCPLLRVLDIFLLFIDEFSRMTLYLLKERSEVSSIIESFFNEIKNQFSISIRVLHTDNALEYVKKDVSVFCSKNCIVHQNLLFPCILTKMELPKENIYIFWMLLEP